MIDMAAKKPTITRVRIAREELEKMTKEDLQKCWNLQDQYVDLLEAKLNSNIEHTELLSLRESEERLKQQQIDASRRENILVMRLTTKEHEMQEFAGQIQELKQAQIPSMAQLRSALLDPAVNLLFEKMRKEMDSLKARLEETQNELNAWKFTPDSNTGKRLMAKCRLLYQENEELGKIISSGRMAKLEGDLALQKNFSEEMKKSQSELDEFLLELDEDVEGMQSTIYYLQQQLRDAKEQINQLQKEKSGENGLSNSCPENSVENNNIEEDSKCPESHFTSKSEMTSPSSNDLNGLENKSVTKIEPMSPDNNVQTNSPKQNVNSSVINDVPAQNNNSPENSLEVSASTVDSHVTPVITNNVEENHDHSVEEKTVIVQNSEMDTSETASLTNDHNSEESTAENALENSKDFEVVQSKTISTNKKTPESTRGRKRTRPHTPVEPDSKEESSLPVRKRTRRREAELLQSVDEKQTPVEINTDAEFQAAHTLASWASKQERTEGQPEVTNNAIGNGELNKEDGEPH